MSQYEPVKMEKGERSQEAISKGAKAAEDYELVRKALALTQKFYRDQPSNEDIAKWLSVSPVYLARILRRWSGLTPKQFLQAVTLDHARHLLRESMSVLDTSYEVGLSGPSRLHDLFITHEAMTPASFRMRGSGLTFRYGFHPTRFGLCLIMMTARGLAGLAFSDPGEESVVLADMKARWPAGNYVEDLPGTAAYIEYIFGREETWKEPLHLVLIGSQFDITVWQSLLAVPAGHLTSYRALAEKIGRPGASRAVGAAVGRNPISFVVPCHRVLASNGDLRGYHWGLTRKRALIGWETGHRLSPTD